MVFNSILRDKDGPPFEPTKQPDFFPDLNLDHVIGAITEPKQEYNLNPFFWFPLRDTETIRYRQVVMQDLENETVMEGIKASAEKMSLVRRYLAMAEELDFDYHKKGWILEAARVYCDTVTKLARHLTHVPLRSQGLAAFRDYLKHYIQSPAFRSLATESQHVKEALAEVRYCVIIQSGKFRVKRYEGEGEYSSEVEKTFEKFKQSDARDYLTKVPERSGMSHIEAKILEFVARLYPEPFAALDQFCRQHIPFLDETIQAFDREIQFYVAYLDFIADLKRQGLPFCYPELHATGKETYVHDGFDLALAHARRDSDQAIVLNDFSLQGPERILVVTGPNQGGKTTFARMFGQLHYLASLGCPVPARKARLFVFDHIFTHFERKEDIRHLRGKLEDDLIRIRDILVRATPDSIIILNEIFSSTTVQDALFLSKEIMGRLMDLDVLGVWVTFLDELASLSEKTVSMVALVDSHDPSTRTFKIVRRPADGLAYALSLARKHNLTYEQIKERVR
ncbi:MutS-related protein [Desulfosoma caldarium]|uniref:MutS-like protein n=1 Tax=Desulfosoma caldarium TaxID=610254 RepID=A0A3N1VPI2_9BACT|nr:DNA mismatch repair protein MutS [Desulfosoma caldarium]ROR02931.1 MutS-like protein [Desulfosoma caldarium]